MDPLSIIVGALAAGALAGTQDAASSSVKDAYAGLKALLRDRLKGRKAAEAALEEHAKAPKIWEAPLKQQLAEAGIDDDAEIVARAEALLAAIPSGTAPGGDVFTVDARGSSHMVFGRQGVQHNHPKPGL